MKLLQFLLIFISCLLPISFATIRFTNVKCDSFDETLIKFEKCVLKLLQRNVVGLNLHIKMQQLPVATAFVNLAILKKANDYRPFLYNVSVDLCEFLKNRKRVPLLDIMYAMVRNTTNVNHTCPYNHDIIVRNMILDVAMFDKLPLPAGEYLTKIRWGIKKNQWHAEIKAYYLISVNL